MTIKIIRRKLGRVLVCTQFLLIGLMFPSIALSSSWYEASTGYTWNFEVNADGKSARLVNPQRGLIASACVTPEPKGKLVIPKEVGGYPLVEIDEEAFDYCCGIDAVVIPDGVKTIGWAAFCFCTYLKSVEIPESVETIARQAFCYCYKLESVSLSKNVTTIESSAFSCCSSLRAIDVDPENAKFHSVDGVLYTRDMTKLCACPGGKCTVQISDTVTIVDTYALWGCVNLLTVELPSSILQIYNYAFRGCDRLASIKIPSGVVSIGTEAFSACGSLTSIEVDAKNGQYASADGLLYNKSMTTLCVCPGGRVVAKIPEGVQQVAYGAFSGCASLVKVSLPESLVIIGSSAFSGCSNLRHLTIPCAVTQVGSGAFGSSLSGVDFEGAPPNGLTDFPRSVSVRYNEAYAEEWDAVMRSCRVLSSESYNPAESEDPLPEPSKTEVTFASGNGVASATSWCYTNAVYSVLPEARRDGFTFAGWYTTLDGTNRVSAFSRVDPAVKTLYARWVEDEKTLYAQWQANRYSVAFYSQGGEGMMDAQSFLYDQSQRLTENGFCRPGYTFLGWATNTTGEVVYVNGQAVSNLTTEADFAVALFAQWSKAVDVSEEDIEEWIVYDLAPMFKKPGETAVGYTKRFKARFGDDYVLAFDKETGKVGQDGTRLCVWHDYVAGTDPLDEASLFSAIISFDEDGDPVVSWRPMLDDEKASRRIYTIYGKSNLDDENWTIVPKGKETEYRFFKIVVQMRQD